MEPIDYSYEPAENKFEGLSYAGFWWRFLAILIDGILLWIVQWIILFILKMAGVHLEATPEETQAITERFLEDKDFMAMWSDLMLLSIPSMIFSNILQWIYFASMESSKTQASLGKMALGIRVTDMNGNRISFLRASGRYWGKIISGLTLGIGYIMAGFTEKKQALHDMMAGCLVMRKEQ